MPLTPSGDCKSSANGQKLPNIQAASSVRAANMDYRGHFELGFGQSLVIESSICNKSQHMCLFVMFMWCDFKWCRFMQNILMESNALGYFRLMLLNFRYYFFLIASLSNHRSYVGLVIYAFSGISYIFRKTK